MGCKVEFNRCMYTYGVKVWRSGFGCIFDAIEQVVLHGAIHRRTGVAPKWFCCARRRKWNGLHVAFASTFKSQIWQQNLWCKGVEMLQRDEWNCIAPCNTTIWELRQSSTCIEDAQLLTIWELRQSSSPFGLCTEGFGCMVHHHTVSLLLYTCSITSPRLYTIGSAVFAALLHRKKMQMQRCVTSPQS